MKVVEFDQFKMRSVYMNPECTYLKSILVDDDIFGHPTYERYCELYKREVLEIKCIKCKSRKLVEI